MNAVDFLDRPLKVGDWVALSDQNNSNRQRLALIYEIGPSRVKIVKKYYNRVIDTYVLKTEHMAILDKNGVPEPIKKEFINYYREKYREGKFIWNESILGSYI